MKLAEALLVRGEMQTKLESLKQRIASNAVVQDGETPHEDPRELIGQAQGLLAEREALVARIHATNLRATLPDGRSLTKVLARRERLAAQHALVRGAVEAATKEPDRYSVREIKWVATLDVRSLQKQADDLATTLREINATIQQANWLIDLDES